MRGHDDDNDNEEDDDSKHFQKARLTCANSGLSVFRVKPRHTLVQGVP